MDLSIIIVSYNTKDLLRECLDSLIRLNSSKNSFKFAYEVIVVDNDSTDGSVEFLKELTSSPPPPRRSIRQAQDHLGGVLRLIENKRNLGFAKANNQGIRKAKGEYVLLLNSDTKIKDNALKRLVDFARSKKNLGIAGSRLLNADGSFQPSTAPFYTLSVVALSLFGGDRFLRRSPAKACQVDWVSGSCFLIKREVIEKIGLLDEKFFMYIEETEFCYRAKKAGFETWFYPQAEIYHLVRGSSPQNKQRVIWWIYEGLIYFYQKHFAPWQLSVLKLLLRTKAGGAWLAGALTQNRYLKETYAKAFKMA